MIDKIKRCPFCVSEPSAGEAIEHISGCWFTMQEHPDIMTRLKAWNYRAPIVIDDAMVERAIRALPESGDARTWMRLCLIAALNREGKT